MGFNILRFCRCFCPFGAHYRRALSNPGCHIAALACPGLGAHCPFGALLERLNCGSVCVLFGALLERLNCGSVCVLFGALGERLNCGSFCVLFGALGERLNCGSVCVLFGALLERLGTLRYESNFITS